MSTQSEHVFKTELRRTARKAVNMCLATVLLVQPGCMCGCSAPAASACLPGQCNEKCSRNIGPELDADFPADEAQSIDLVPEQGTQ